MAQAQALAGFGVLSVDVSSVWGRPNLRVRVESHSSDPDSKDPNIRQGCGMGSALKGTTSITVRAPARPDTVL